LCPGPEAANPDRRSCFQEVRLGRVYSGFMIRYLAITAAAVVALGVFAKSPEAKPGTEHTQVVGQYRFELEVLPPEPFYTKTQVESEHIKKGMLVIRGAAPVQPGANSHPDHHLVVHLFDEASGKAVTGAQVTMRYQRLTQDGEPAGPATRVPVTEMQVIGKGPSTTHYGNNVTLPSGSYQVTIEANNTTAKFAIKV